jgi:hypothetical protein
MSPTPTFSVILSTGFLAAPAGLETNAFIHTNPAAAGKTYPDIQFHIHSTLLENGPKYFDCYNYKPEVCIGVIHRLIYNPSSFRHY